MFTGVSDTFWTLEEGVGVCSSFELLIESSAVLFLEIVAESLESSSSDFPLVAWMYSKPIRSLCASE